MVCFVKDILEETESNVMPKEEDYVRVYMTVCGLGAAARRAPCAYGRSAARTAGRRLARAPSARGSPRSAAAAAVLVRRAGRANGNARPVRSRGRSLRLAGGRAGGTTTEGKPCETVAAKGVP